MRATFSILLGIGTVMTVSAQTPVGSLGPLLASRPVVSKTVTMDEAVDLALKNSPVVLGSAAELNAAVGRLRSARAEMRPWLSANAFASGGGGTGIVATPPPTQPAAIMGLPGGRFADLNLSLMLPLVTSGRLEGMVRQAAALRHASEADLATQRQEVTLMTRTAYHDVQARRAMVGVAQARLKENEERLKNDAARLKQQSIPEYYLRRDEAEVASARQDVTNAQRDVDISLVGLKTVIGVSPASQLDVTGDLDSPNTAEFLAALTAGSGAQPDDTLSALLNLAERKRPELMAGSRRVEGARADTTSVRGSYLPQLSLGVMGDWMKAGSMNASARTTAAVIASIPLYSGGQREGRIREAEGMREKQEQDLRQVALQVAQDVQNALLNLRAADQNVGAAQAGQKAAESEYAAAQLRYQVGRSVAAEMLDSLASRVRAQSDVVQALYLYNVARDQLLRAVGGLGASPPS